MTATRWAMNMVMLLCAAALISGPSETARAEAIAPAVYGTVPVDILPGTVRIDWAAERVDATVGCTATAWIRSEHATRPIVAVYAVHLSGAGEGSEMGQTPRDSIAPGRYLIDLGGSGCSWSMNFVTR
jgi:hypothetical protein